MDGTEKDPGALPEGGQPSGADTQETSLQKPKTYTEKDVEKAVSDAKAAAGRLAKENEALKAQYSTLEQEHSESRERLDAIQKQIDEADLSKARGDPDMLDLYQQRRAVRDELVRAQKAMAEVKKDQAKLAADKAEVAEFKKAKAITEIASKHGIDPKVLLDLNLETAEQMEAVAKVLEASKPVPTPAPEEESVPDSSITIGGTGTLTVEQMDKMSMEEYAAWRKKKPSPK